MAIIPLNCRFVVWANKEGIDPDFLSHFLPEGSTLGWSDLLEKHRVVILAEAGSGKSAELEQQARLIRAEGKYAYEATVQSVGERGFKAAIAARDAAQLDLWKASDQPAWFFLDSVDEAKSRNVRLADALRELSAAIYGVEGRAHIVLSGRYSDWEFRRDLETLEQLIPMPPEDLAVAAIDPNQLIIKTLRRDKPPEVPPDQPVLI